jgi:hypothetical protein
MAPMQDRDKLPLVNLFLYPRTNLIQRFIKNGSFHPEVGRSHVMCLKTFTVATRIDHLNSDSLQKCVPNSDTSTTNSW